MKRIIVLTAFICFSFSLVKADVADFNYTTVCEGSNVLFSSTSQASSGSIVSYGWDFNNDGIFTDATGPKATYLFSTSGSFDIGLRITNSNSTVTTTYKTVVVNPLADVDFTVGDVCLGDQIMAKDISIIVSGSIAKYKWDYNNDGIYDDSSSSSTTFVHAFNQAGTYTIGHEVVSNKGCVSSAKKPVNIFHKPTVDFTFDNTCLNDETSFSATASIAGGYINGYHWNFDGDAIYEDSTANGYNSTNFINYGNYQVSVRVESDKGCLGDTSKLVVIAPRPTLNFTFSNKCKNKELLIDNSFSNAKDYVWDFGDGGTSLLETPTHVYSQDGTFSIKLVGSTAQGCSDSITKTVTIYPSPVSYFSYTDVCVGDVMSFGNQSMDNGVPITNYYWDFGDGHGEISKEPLHLYTDADSFEVSLVVDNQYGCSDTSMAWVHVFELPNPAIMAGGPTEFCKGGNVDLEVSLGSGEHVIWSTGDETDMINVDEERTYYAIVYDNYGCQNKDSIKVTVYSLPDISLNTSDTSISKGRSVELLATGGVSYEWSPVTALERPMSSNPVATPLDNIVYEVTAYSEHNCTSKRSVSIDVIEDYLIDFENLITPNGDGKNDVWNINLSIYEDNEVIIYNKWGTEIFRQKNYQDNWDGTYNGEPVPNGTYYYLVRFDGSKKVYNGSLTILR